ncbi:MAG: lipid II flippase MurJ [Ornithinimicrobium sp.]
MSIPSPRLAAGSIMATAGLVAAITLVSRAVGLSRWVVFSNSVGTTCLGTVYATANQVPNVLYEAAAGGALAAVAVPLISTYLHQGKEREADHSASALLTWALLMLVPVSLAVILLANPLAVLLMGSSTQCSADETHRVAALMLLVFAPQIALYGVGVVLTGVLQAHRRFLAAAIAPLLSSLVVIGTYLAYGALFDPTVPLDQAPRSGILLLAAGTTAGVVALSLPLLWPTSAIGVRLRPRLRFPDGTGAMARSLAVAGLIAVLGQQVVVVVALVLSNRVGVGTINVFTYTQTAYLLPYALLAVPLATVAFPRFTDPEEGTATLRATTRAVLLTAVLGMAALLILRREAGAVFLSLDAGSSGSGRAALLALPAALAAYAPGLVGFAVAAVLTRALYAVGSPLRAAVAISTGWAVAGVLPVVLFATLNVDSPQSLLVILGLGSSLGMTVTALMLSRAVRVTWHIAALSGTGRVVAAAVVASAVVFAAREILAFLGVWPGVHQGPWSAILSATILSMVLVTAVALAVGTVDRPALVSMVDGIRRRLATTGAGGRER